MTNIDLDIEKSILSSILFNNKELEYLSNKLNVEDFYLKEHQNIYEKMLFLYNQDLPVDEIFLLKHLDKSYENSLLNILSLNPITDIKSYTKSLKESSLKRKLIDYSTNIRNLVFDEENKNLEKLLEVVENDFYKITLQEENRANFRVNEVLENLINKKNEDKNRINLELESVDKILGSIEEGDLVVIAGRPSMGKTAFLVSLTNNFLEKNYGVLLVTLEMTSEKIMRRLISCNSGLKLNKLKEEDLSSNKKFKKSLEFFKDKELIFNEKTRPTIRELSKDIKKTLKDNPNIKEIFIDHIGQIKLLGKQREDIEIGEITKELKSIAREFGVRIYILHQLNRKVEDREDKHPKMSDLKNSGSIEEDADIVMFLYNSDYYNGNKKNSVVSEIIVGKNRDGETGTAKLNFEKDLNKFHEKKKESDIWINK